MKYQLLTILLISFSCSHSSNHLEKIEPCLNYKWNQEVIEAVYNSAFENGEVKRWEKPIKIHLAGDYSERDSLEILTVIDELRSIKNLTIQMSNNKNDSNLKINFVLKEQSKNHPLGRTFTGSNFFYSDIRDIKINIYSADATFSLNRTIRHEIMHAFGFFHFKGKQYESAIGYDKFKNTELLFTNKPVPYSFKQFDLDMVRLLYCIPNGTSKEQYAESFNLNY